MDADLPQLSCRRRFGGLAIGPEMERIWRNARLLRTAGKDEIVSLKQYMFGLALFGFAFAYAPASAREDARLLVFAAASLSDVMEEVGDAYETQTENEIAFSFASSMTLARQIEASSGVDLFISADLESMDYLESRGFILSSTRKNLLQNELVLVAPSDSNVQLAVAPGFALAESLGEGRLALANTLSVPAGRYARAALNSLNVWESVSHVLAEAEDVRAALALVARAEAPLGIVYATDARAESRVRVVAHFPVNSHPPILYPAALTAEGRPDARAFLDFLEGGVARMIFESAGFTTF
jgi:molybdate transport system substrate-binding protein